MKYDNIFYEQSQLLIDVLPFVSEEECFALKGGTAINYFLQNMPRLSVDIDLTFLPLLPRADTLTAINLATQRISRAIEANLAGASILLDRSEQAVLPKLNIQRRGVEIKIEVNPIFRGSVFSPAIKSLCHKAQEIFESFVKMSVCSSADLYAGKFCAALNRQHPRDLFDVKLLLDQGGIAEDIRQAFVVYLASDRRPMNELLTPNIKPLHIQQELHERQFSGMVVHQDVHYKELETIVEILANKLKQLFTIHEKQFLLSLAAGEPEWQLLPFEHIAQLPSLQWKLINIRKMDAQKRNQAYKALEVALQV